jgi:hypothetical protein
MRKLIPRTDGQLRYTSPKPAVQSDLKHFL